MPSAIEMCTFYDNRFTKINQILFEKSEVSFTIFNKYTRGNCNQVTTFILNLGSWGSKGGYQCNGEITYLKSKVHKLLVIVGNNTSINHNI